LPFLLNKTASPTMQLNLLLPALLSLVLSSAMVCSSFVLHQASPAAPFLTRKTAPSPLYGTAAGDEWDDDARRFVISTSAAALTAVSAATPSAQAFLGDPPSIDEQVRAIETANRIGQPFKKIYEPNTNGDPSKHIPLVTVGADGLVTVSVNHVMKPEHYIQFMWLKDVKKDEVVCVKGFPSSEPSPPTLKVKCPPGAELRPYLFCNLHGLWKGDEFTVA